MFNAHACFTSGLFIHIVHLICHLQYKNNTLIDFLCFGFWQKGHDTTTSGITFCLYNIAKHPEVQEKCIEEIVSVFGTDGKQPITLSQLNQLAYLDMVIKESLRLYPSVPLIGRKAMEDIKLSMNLF